MALTELHVALDELENKRAAVEAGKASVKDAIAALDAIEQADPQISAAIAAIKLKQDAVSELNKAGHGAFLRWSIRAAAYDMAVAELKAAQEAIQSSVLANHDAIKAQAAVGAAKTAQYELERAYRAAVSAFIEATRLEYR